MKITNEFTVHTPIERAWAVLTDLEGIAPCLPGAQLTGVDGDTYSGKVKVKVGPVVSDFAGTARFIAKDDAARRAVIDAKGRDSRSAGNAAAVVTAQLRADGDRTLVSVDTDLKISGKLAQFGSGMIKEVSSKLLGQFVTNLEAKLAAEPDVAGSAATDPATPAHETPAGRATGTPLRPAAPGGAASAGGTGIPTPAPDPAASDKAAGRTSAAASGKMAGSSVAAASGAAEGPPAAAASGTAGDSATGEVAGSGGAAGSGTAGDAAAGEVAGSGGAAGSGTAGDAATGTAEGSAAGEAGSGEAADSGVGEGSGGRTVGADEVAGAESLNGAAVRILPGRNGPLPAVAPLSAESGGAAAAAGGAAGGSEAGEAGATVGGGGGASGASVPVPDARDEPEALDLLALAGGSIYRRVIPLGIGAVVVAAVIVWFVSRR